MTQAHNPMSPSLAGIVADPSDNSRRIIPSSQRGDGSVRKERKVRPGHVPAEDIAKYKPGQGSLRAQHAVAQSNNQAPPSPSPAPAAVPLRKPNPADFLTDRQHPSSSTTSVPPPQSPTKAAASSSSSKGASLSRWATAAASAAPEPTPAPASAPVTHAPTSPRLGGGGRGKPRTRGGPRKGKGPTVSALSSEAAHETESEVEEQDQEEDKENVPAASLPAPAPAPSIPDVPSTPESKIPELPDTPGGDWWADDDEDEDVDAAVQALQGISIKDAASRQRAASPTPAPSSNNNSSNNNNTKFEQRPATRSSTTQSQHGSHASHEDTARGKKVQPEKNQQQTQSQAKTPAKKTTQVSNGAANLLSRMGPAPIVPTSEAEKTPTATATATAKHHNTLGRLSLDEIRTRSRTISTKLQELNKIKQYGAAGAILSNDQNAELDTSSVLLQELSEMKVAAQSLAEEVSHLYENARS